MNLLAQLLESVHDAAEGLRIALLRNDGGHILELKQEILKLSKEIDRIV